MVFLTRATCPSKYTTAGFEAEYNRTLKDEAPMDSRNVLFQTTIPQMCAQSMNHKAAKRRASWINLSVLIVLDSLVSCFHIRSSRPHSNVQSSPSILGLPVFSK